ncbi:MAG: hypothetical protein PHO10_12680, partial [Gemmiger sp.]|nr:hypothetical protein [Gemmiger sp.]
DGDYIKNCAAINLVVGGSNHQGALSSTVMGIETISNSFASNCKIFSNVGHSGGLLSCIGGIAGGRTCVITDCFADCEIYGTDQTGGFTGVITGRAGDISTTFDRCFSTGFVDGTTNIGGFVGQLGESSYLGIVNFTDCFTTSHAGMNSTGNHVGGFLGRSDTAGNNFTNCYAAGEVGNAGTTMENGGNNGQYAGGFIGYINGNKAQTFTNCYYDKQTTAMHERQTGNDTYNADGTITTYASGITGVLTSNTAKSGTGLTDDTTGLAGIKSGNWNLARAEHYPELTTFSAPVAAANGWSSEMLNGYQALIENTSITATSTVTLEAWDKGLEEKDGTLVGGAKAPGALVYDTVRDVVYRFYLTAPGITRWTTTTTQTGADGSSATSTPAGVDRKVLTLQHEDNKWFADYFTPGVEWLKAYSPSGETHRRIRVMPTAGLEAGDKDGLSSLITLTGLNKTELYYDHADGVQFYYSTSSRMIDAASNTVTGDITTGMWPDITQPNSSISPRQLATIRGGYGGSDAAATAAADAFFATQDDQFIKNTPGDAEYTGVDMSYMARNKDTPLDAARSENSAKGSLAFMYAREVIIDPIANTVTTGSIMDLTENATNFFKEQLNGQSPNGDLKNAKLLWLLDYVWQLNDGRIVRDTKLLEVTPGTLEAYINTYDTGADIATDDITGTTLDLAGLAARNDPYADTDDGRVQMYGKTPQDDNRNDNNWEPQSTPPPGTFDPVEPDTNVPAPNFGDFSGRVNYKNLQTAQDKITVERNEKVLATWTVDPDKSINAVRLTFDSSLKDAAGNEVYYTGATAQDLAAGTVVTPGTPLTVEYTARQITQKEPGVLTMKNVTIQRTYTIEKTT